MRPRTLIAVLLALAFPLFAAEKTQEKHKGPRVRITVGGGSTLLGTQFTASSLDYNRGASIFNLLDEASRKFTRGTIFPQGANADAYVLGGPTPNINPGDTYLLYGRQWASKSSDDPSASFNTSVDVRLSGSLWLQTGYQMGTQATFKFDNTRDFINVTRVDQVAILPPRVLHIGMDRRYIARQDEFKVRGHAFSTALKYDFLNDRIVGIAPVVGVQYTLVRNRHWSVQRESVYTHFVAEELAGGFPNGMADLRSEIESESGVRSVTYAGSWKSFVGLDLRFGSFWDNRNYSDAPIGIFVQGRYAFRGGWVRFSPQIPYGTVNLKTEVEEWHLIGGLTVGF